MGQQTNIFCWLAGQRNMTNVLAPKTREFIRPSLPNGIDDTTEILNPRKYQAFTSQIKQKLSSKKRLIQTDVFRWKAFPLPQF